MKTFLFIISILVLFICISTTKLYADVDQYILNTKDISDWPSFMDKLVVTDSFRYLISLNMNAGEIINEWDIGNKGLRRKRNITEKEKEEIIKAINTFIIGNPSLKNSITSFKRDAIEYEFGKEMSAIYAKKPSELSKFETHKLNRAILVHFFSETKMPVKKKPEGNKKVEKVRASSGKTPVHISKTDVNKEPDKEKNVMGIPAVRGILTAILVSLIFIGITKIMMKFIKKKNPVLFEKDDIIDWQTFLKRLINPRSRAGERLLRYFSENLKLKIFSEEQVTEKTVIDNLNRILSNKSFFSPEDFRKLNLESEEVALIGVGVNYLPQNDIIKLNRLLIESIFPGMIKKYKEKTKSPKKEKPSEKNMKPVEVITEKRETKELKDETKKIARLKMEIDRFSKNNRLKEIRLKYEGKSKKELLEYCNPSERREVELIYDRLAEELHGLDLSINKLHVLFQCLKKNHHGEMESTQSHKAEKSDVHISQVQTDRSSPERRKVLHKIRKPIKPSSVKPVSIEEEKIPSPLLEDVLKQDEKKIKIKKEAKTTEKPLSIKKVKEEKKLIELTKVDKVINTLNKWGNPGFKKNLEPLEKKYKNWFSQIGVTNPNTFAVKYSRSGNIVLEKLAGGPVWLWEIEGEIYFFPNFRRGTSDRNHVKYCLMDKEGKLIDRAIICRNIKILSPGKCGVISRGRRWELLEKCKIDIQEKPSPPAMTPTTTDNNAISTMKSQKKNEKRKMNNPKSIIIKKSRKKTHNKKQSSVESKTKKSNKEDKISKIKVQPFRILHGHSSKVTSLSISSEAGILASGSDDSAIRIWDISTGYCRFTMKGHKSGVLCVKILPDGRTLVSAGRDSTIRVWDHQRGKEIGILFSFNYPVTGLAFSKKYRMILVSSLDQKISIWDIERKKLSKFKGDKEAVKTVCVNHTGSKLASVGTDEAIKVWELPNCKKIRTLPETRREIYAIALSTGGRSLATCGSDKAIRIWDTTSGHYIKRLQGHKMNVRCLSFLTNTDILVSGSDDSTLRFWDYKKGVLLKTVPAHKKGINVIKASVDSKMLATVGQDNLIRLWNVDW